MAWAESNRSRLGSSLFLGGDIEMIIATRNACPWISRDVKQVRLTGVGVEPGSHVKLRPGLDA
jgi:hypothetical protein